MPDAGRGWVGDLMRFAGLGMQLAIWVGLFGLLGWRADRWLDTTPWLLLVACLLGAACGMWNVVRSVTQDPELNAPRTPRKPGPESTPDTRSTAVEDRRDEPT